MFYGQALTKRETHHFVIPFFLAKQIKFSLRFICNVKNQHDCMQPLGIVHTMKDLYREWGKAFLWRIPNAINGNVKW